jgi:dolichyl-phosphate-mannose-protein mannosyltransferase
LRGVSYWDKKDKTGRIYLLGNPVSWYIALLGIFCFCVIGLKEMIKDRRGKVSKKESEEDRLARFDYLKKIGFLFVAWAVHYLPFFTMSRTLYLHHYLPAYQISCMISGAMLDYSFYKSKKKTLLYGMLGIAAILTMLSFFYFSAITYGYPIASGALDSKKWLQSWDWP